MRPFRHWFLSALLMGGLASALPAQAPPPTANGAGDLLVAPTRVVFEGRKRSAELNLSNLGQARATFRISLARMDMDEAGAFKERPIDPGSENMQSLFRFSPREVTLEPQESQTVRIQVRKPAELPAGEYRLHILFRAVPTTAPVPSQVETPRPSPAKPEAPKAMVAKSEVPKHTQAHKPVEAPRAPSRRDPPSTAETPAGPTVPTKAEAPKGVSIRLIPVYGIAIPLIVRHGDTSAKVSISDPILGEGARSLRFRLERSGNQSVYGDLQATLLPPTGSPIVLAEMAGLAVYTPNSGRTVTMILPAAQSLPPGSRIRITYSLPAEERGTLLAETFLPVP